MSVSVNVKREHYAELSGAVFSFKSEKIDLRDIFNVSA